MKCDGTRTETRFRLSAKRTSSFKSAEASVQSTSSSRSVRISGSNAGYTMFRGSVKGTGHPLHSSVSPSLPLPCITVCHHVSTGLYKGGQGKDKGKGCPVTRQVGTEGGATSIAVPLINLESGRKLHLPTNWRCTGLLLHLIILKDTNTHTHTQTHTR